MTRPQHRPNDYQPHTAEAEEQVQAEAQGGHCYAGGETVGAFIQAQQGADHDGHHGGAHPGHGGGHPGVALKGGIAVGDPGQHDEGGGDHAEHTAQAAQKAGLTVAEEHGGVGDHGPGQTAAHAGQIQQVLVGQHMLLIHISLFHLGHDAPAAPEGEAAKQKKLAQQRPAALETVQGGYLLIKKHKTSRKPP